MLRRDDAWVKKVFRKTKQCARTTERSPDGRGDFSIRHPGMRLLAQTRNPLFLSLWIPGSLAALAPRNDDGLDIFRTRNIFQIILFVRGASRGRF